ncbi:hypothetical protein [Mycobacterium asiaticum]|uniref:Uncharacterized protein n=1 Tax=Mycobacterium asiaticum TaxID=1790 RepID=A0A1A3L2H0_MYCAS|nr:hypothetical protein [Mycobacterium asiaticum]OBJ90899.1 hypothetical protein A5640_02060 [Mycobacterium asiaticum]
MTAEKTELIRRAQAAMELIMPKELTVEELRALVAVVEAAVRRLTSDPAARIYRALDAIEASGWTDQQLTQVALTLESIARKLTSPLPTSGLAANPAASGFRPYVVRGDSNGRC